MDTRETHPRRRREGLAGRCCGQAGQSGRGARREEDPSGASTQTPGRRKRMGPARQEHTEEPLAEKRLVWEL